MNLFCRNNNKVIIRECKEIGAKVKKYGKITEGY